MRFKAVEWIHLAQDTGHWRRSANTGYIHGAKRNMLGDYQLLKKNSAPSI
jgi:hypothetical protein